MEMVRRGYQPVIDPQSFTFGPVTAEMNGRPTQVVTILDKAGKSWTALYAFERQPDGTWRISGVILKGARGGRCPRFGAHCSGVMAGDFQPMSQKTKSARQSCLNSGKFEGAEEPEHP